MGPGHSSLRQAVLGLSTPLAGLMLCPWHKIGRFGAVPLACVGEFLFMAVPKPEHRERNCSGKTSRNIFPS